MKDIKESVIRFKNFVAGVFTGIFLMSVLACIISVVFQTCHSQKPTVIHTEKVKAYKDTIRAIQTKYATIYKRIEVSSEPDTFIRYILRTDTVTGNVDSFVAVQVAKGRECLEVQPWKDSILYDDSVQLWTLHKALNDCTKAHDKKEKSLKLWQCLSVGLGFILSGAILIK